MRRYLLDSNAVNAFINHHEPLFQRARVATGWPGLDWRQEGSPGKSGLGATGNDIVRAGRVEGRAGGGKSSGRSSILYSLSSRTCGRV